MRVKAIAFSFKVIMISLVFGAIVPRYRRRLAVGNWGTARPGWLSGEITAHVCRIWIKAGDPDRNQVAAEQTG